MKERNELIVKENHLIEGFVEMTKNEYKFILYLISKIKKDDENFRKQKVSVKEFSDVLDYKGEGLYQYMKEFEDSLIKKHIRIENSEGDRVKINWLSYIRYFNDAGTLEVAFNSDLVPYLLNLDTRFTKYLLKNIIGLNSIYSIRIYELLKQYEKIKKRVIKLEDLKKMLGIADDQYKLYGHFKQRILLKAKEELAENEDTDIYFDFEELKRGRKVTAIKFIIKEKEVPQKELEFEEYQKKKEYSQETLELFKLLPQEEQVEAHKRELAELLKEHSYKYLEADIEYAKRFGVNNFFGFLKSSCEGGHYSAAELEKQEKEEGLAKQREEEKKKKEELKEKIQKRTQEKAIEKYDKLSTKEIESYDETYQKLPKMLKDKISKKEFIVGALEEEVEKEIRELLMIMEN